MTGPRRWIISDRAQISQAGALGQPDTCRPGTSASAADGRDGNPASGPARTARFPGRYLSLATFRRDGTAVATPVWFARDGGLLLVWTNERSGKVKRIGRNPSVTIAPCTVTGRLRAQPVPAQARLLPAGEAARAKALLARKYRYDMALLRALEAVIALARRRRTAGAQVYIEITPAGAQAATGRQG